MSQSTIPLRSVAFLRRWVATVGCLLLLIVVSGADELYDFAATDLRGTPSLVTLRSGQRSVTRSRRRAILRRQSRQARKESVRRERIRYVRTRKPLRLPASRLPAPDRIAAARPIRPARKKRPVRLARSTPRSTTRSTPRSTAKRRVAGATRPASRSKKPVLTRSAPRTTGSSPARSTPKSQGRNTFPTRLPPPVVLAARPEESDAIEDRAEQDVAVEVRQNLSLAFVTPRNSPAAGVRLVARVVPAQGEEVTYSNLQTDRRGRIKLFNIALPAAIDLDFSGQETSAPSTLASSSSKSEPLEWDFADAERATLLLEKPLGLGRSALATGSSRLAGLGPETISEESEKRPAAASRRVRLFEGEATPIVLERQVIDLDIAAPPGSLLSSPALEDAQLEDAPAVEAAGSAFEGSSEGSSMSTSEALLVPPSGRVALRLPREALEEGPIPIRVARSLAGGEAEAVIESYPTDAYASNRIESPPLRLVRLSQLDMAGRVGVMGTRANVARRLGDLTSADNKGNALGSVTAMADGSEWWIYPETGISFKMRSAPDASAGNRNAPMFVERVRLFSTNAGSFGTVAVGSTVEQMRASLGTPQVENDKRTPSDALSTPGRIDVWLDGGLRVCHDGSRVLWLESARPNVLLTGGTTAFVGRTRARLFVESFQGHPEVDLASISEVRKYLEQAHGVETVDTRQDADLVLQARVSEWKQDKGSPSSSLAGPTERYSSLVRLQFSLLDATAGRALVENKQVEGRATANVSSATGAGTLADQVDKRKRALQKMASDGAAKSIRAALDVLVADVNRLSDFSVRVTKIDYQAGTLQLNAGRAQGLRASRLDPQDFEISVAGATLPENEREDDLEFYTARVISVGENSAVCRLLRVNLFSRNGKEGIEELPAPEMVRRLPDPTTGVVAARPWIPIALSTTPRANPARAATPRG